MSLREQLSTVIHGEILDTQEQLDSYSRDASLFEMKPQVVVVPQDVADLKSLIQFATTHEGVSLTARAGGTDMSGGPLSQSIVVDFKNFNTVLSVDPVTSAAVTQPGVFYRDFEKVTLEKNLLLPTYPASRQICMVGGMVANNAGGEKSLSYGQTRDYVKQLKVILADGNEYTVGPLNRSQLQEKLNQQDFEGEFYRKVFQIVEDNYEVIQSSQPHVAKNSAGYALGRVWDKATFNLAHLFTGSQGTLGLISEITFRLVQPKSHTKLLVVFLKDLVQLPVMVNKILAHGPESLESYDDKTLQVAMKYLPEFIQLMGARNSISLGIQFLPELFMTLVGGMPKMVLMAEFTGTTQEEAETKLRSAQQAVEAFQVKTRVTHTEQEAQKYWTIRRESFNLLRHHIKDKQTAPFIDDVIVPPEVLPEFLPKLEAILWPYNLTYSIVGHVGSGNMHIIPLMNLADVDTEQTISDISRKVYDLVLRYKGSITAEHNDGLIRTPFVKQMYGEQVYKLFEDVKRIFDPKNIFNPGKKVGTTWEQAVKYLKHG